MVHKKDVKNTMDGEKNKRGSFGNGWYGESTDDHHKKETAWVSGHALRADGLEKSVLLGFIKGRRARGRQRLKYMDGIVEVIGCGTAAEVVRLTEDRGGWHSIIANVNIDTVLR